MEFENVCQDLFSLADEKYKEFHKKLIPTVPEEKIIGVRTPILRAYAKRFAKSEYAAAFLANLPHKYYEENNLHAFVIETIKDYDETVYMTEKFLPYIDNWATCDSFSPKVFGKHKAELAERIKNWIKSDRTYTVRYAIVTLMNLYLKEDFLPEYFDMVISAQKNREYYIQMAAAWYFSAALVWQYDEVVSVLEKRTLEPFVHNKTIQKAVESFRIEKEKKAFLKTLKI